MYSLVLAYNMSVDTKMSSLSKLGMLATFYQYGMLRIVDKLV